MKSDRMASVSLIREWARRCQAVVVMFVIATAAAMAQGNITPVDNDPGKPPRPVLHYYDRHGNALQTPVLFLSELDTVKNVRSGPVYSAVSGVSVGLNFFDAVLKVFGQSYSSFDIHADMTLYNWLMPVVEAGIGFASSSPDNGAFNIKVRPSPYLKVGFNYNFLYKSNPDYQFWLGLRAGVAHSRYDVRDITPSSDYYTEGGPTAYDNIRCTSWYGDALAGLRVRIAGPLSLGWSLRYHFFFAKARRDMVCPPWFVPGFGHNPLGATFSIYINLYTNRTKKDILPISTSE